MDRSLNSGPMRMATQAVVYGLGVWKICDATRWRRPDGTGLCAGHLHRQFIGSSSPSTVPWLGGRPVVYGRSLRAYEEVVAPDAAADDSTLMRFRIQTRGSDDSAHENGSFCWALPLLEGNLKRLLDQQLDIQPLVQV